MIRLNGAQFDSQKCHGFSAIIGPMSYEMRKIRRYTEWQSMPYKEKSQYDDFQIITIMAQNAGIPKMIIDSAIILFRSPLAFNRHTKSVFLYEFSVPTKNKCVQTSVFKQVCSYIRAFHQKGVAFLDGEPCTVNSSTLNPIS